MVPTDQIDDAYLIFEAQSPLPMQGLTSNQIIKIKAIWNYFDTEHARTTNTAKSFYSKLKAQSYCRKTAYAAIEHLQKIQNESEIEIKGLKNGGRCIIVYRVFI